VQGVEGGMVTGGVGLWDGRVRDTAVGHRCIALYVWWRRRLGRLAMDLCVPGV